MGKHSHDSECSERASYRIETSRFFHGLVASETYDIYDDTVNGRVHIENHIDPYKPIDVRGNPNRSLRRG